MSLTPLSADLMGWRGAGGSGAAGMQVFLSSYLLSAPTNNLQWVVLLLWWPTHDHRGLP